MSVYKIIKIDDVEYVRKDLLSEIAPKVNGMEYCIVRTYSAGVFAGYVKSEVGQEVVILRARRLWRWAGASTLSQLAVEGTTTPDDCKFPCEVSEVRLKNVIEIIPCTNIAQASIASVKIWKV